MANINKGLYSSNSEEYETPAYIFNLLHALYDFKLDAAANKSNAKCRNYFTQKDDALNKDWHSHIMRLGGSVWLNPPYGRKIKAFMAKAYEEYTKGVTVVCLVPARTDAAWWHDYAMKGQVILLRGRLKFGGGKTSAPFPSAIVIFDANKTRGNINCDFQGVGQCLMQNITI